MTKKHTITKNHYHLANPTFLKKYFFRRQRPPPWRPPVRGRGGRPYAAGGVRAEVLPEAHSPRGRREWRRRYGIQPNNRGKRDGRRAAGKTSNSFARFDCKRAFFLAQSIKAVLKHFLVFVIFDIDLLWGRWYKSGKCTESKWFYFTPHLEDAGKRMRFI